MWKLVVVAMAVLAIAGSSTVFAQQGNADHNGAVRFEHRHRQFSAEDRAAFVDARIAALKAGLELTPDQTKNWPTFEQALRDMAKLRAQIRAARDAQEQNATPNTPFERMSQRADNLAKTSAALKRIADAGAPLYQTLDDAQKSTSRNSRACYGPIITACTLGTMLLAVVVRASATNVAENSRRGLIVEFFLWC